MNNNVHRRINLKIIETSMLGNKMQKSFASFHHTIKQIITNLKG